ncbi:hypothetical protein DF186_17265 [Enterococcus hirae]|nr:hypothetical protein DF186_17265 [Enterococcus hirae]
MAEHTAAVPRAVAVPESDEGRVRGRADRWSVLMAACGWIDGELRTLRLAKRVETLAEDAPTGAVLAGISPQDHEITIGSDRYRRR